MSEAALDSFFSRAVFLAVGALSLLLLEDACCGMTNKRTGNDNGENKDKQRQRQEQPQVLRLRRSQDARTTSLRMTGLFVVGLVDRV
jgi:hypothetical protein